ncbi:MAG: excinuclease ABC subunit UvrA [Tissierellia bacterium]|nr:excinuclease ABC subunit UvrA [Tissierellia bacterium]
MDFNAIVVHEASENNLKNISLEIPKNKITVVTGLSGSGKSSLVMDTIAAQSRRELNDTFPSFAQRYLPKYTRPHVAAIDNLPVAIVVDQKKPSGNVRSTVGTFTDTYTLLRLLFSRIGEPFVGYSDAFSFNHPSGRCPKCDGLGEITEIDVHKLVDFNKSLNEPGVINYVAYEPGQWRWLYYGASGLYDPNKKIKDFTKEELDLFLYQEPMKLKNPPPEYYKNGNYEGLMYRMNRMLKRDDAKVHWKRLEPLVDQGICPLCHGTRLNQKILSCKIDGKNIAEISQMPLNEILEWTEAFDNPVALDIRDALISRIKAMIDIGLPYLNFDRPMGTLSGGEAQRCKIAKYNNTSLSDLLYILDEPSSGLHSHDIHLLSEAVISLRDRGNTVLMVEHNPEMIDIADHIVDLGPGAGVNGGEIQFEGNLQEFLKGSTLTGELLNQRNPLKKKVRKPKEWFKVKNANNHNLKNINVELPLGVLTVISGVAGSGKSSLMQEFAKQYPGEVTLIEQGDIGASLRSTPATYMNVAGEIRKVFSKVSGRKAGLFSFNGEGACPICQGKGIIVSEMSFMDNVETECEKCHGLRFNEDSLQYKFRGLNIAETLDLTVKQAMQHFSGDKSTKKIVEKLRPLVETGLSYLHLNQSLSTLSGGELQRMKLASEKRDAKKIFIIDEPTNGLHLKDVSEIVKLFDRMVDEGNSVFLVEHNLDVLKAADYAIEVGPYGGKKGGELLFTGTPKQMLEDDKSVTAPYLKKSLGQN